MEQALGFHTVHKALSLIADDAGQYGEPEMLDADLVLVDEVSMLNIYLAKKLFQAIPNGCRVILVGDSDQLPSVRPGVLLKEMIASGKVPVVRLDQVFRQKEGSRIYDCQGRSIGRTEKLKHDNLIRGPCRSRKP